MVVEMAQWKRIHKRVDDLEKRWSIDWLAVSASASLSVAGGALIAVLTLPPAEPSTKIGPAVKPVLWVILAVSALLSAALIYLASLARDERKVTGSDICNEMDTIKEAWEQRESEGKPLGA